MEQKNIKRILIANRGEIALRIQATCHTLGIETIAIYTQEDRFASYVYKATTAKQLSLSGPAGYLNQQEIIEIVKQTNADAIHPGYGFLAENSQFAQHVIDNGFLWIGPTPENIALLGDKAAAQRTMQQARVPTIPGRVFDASQPEIKFLAEQFAKKIGFPVLLKCAHAGGGKAMRLVNSEKFFSSSWKTVTSEAKTQFNSTAIIVEKYLYKPRHVEIQIAGDGKNFIHLYERECSIQRNHQKIIEEAPCQFISKKIKEQLFEAAILAARATNYQNIGTVEFLVTEDEKFYFLEMNTRLQVEHSITESITGIDLVQLQLYIAIFNTLPYKQNDISIRGHAIECRIYSEDPAKNFMPSTGIIHTLVLPNYPFLRIDHDLEENCKITPLFDPMILKLTTCGQNRDITKNQMFIALKSMFIGGIKTNRHFLLAILNSDLFSNGEFHTQLVQHFTFDQSTKEECPIKLEDFKKILFSREKPKSIAQKNFWKEQRWK
jgi:acetyl/propionyl-CoA carboxylase alpha subunit